MTESSYWILRGDWTSLNAVARKNYYINYSVRSLDTQHGNNLLSVLEVALRNCHDYIIVGGSGIIIYEVRQGLQ